MFLKEIVNLLESNISPKYLSSRKDIYGIQYGESNGEKFIKKVLVTVDLSIESIKCAIKRKTNLIISQHGLINNSITKIDSTLTKKLLLLSKYPITIFTLNSSFFAAEGGITDTLLDILYLKIDKVFNIKRDDNKKIPIGRICLTKNYLNKNGPFKLIELLKRLKLNLNCEHINYIGNLDYNINKIFLLLSESTKRNYIQKALEFGCDCYISGEILYHNAVLARDMGLNLIEIPNYEIKEIALKKLSNSLSLEFPHDEFFWFDSKNPFNFY